MGKQTFPDRVREFIVGIGWSIFLWSIRMTQDEYIDSVIRDERDDGAPTTRVVGELVDAAERLLKLRSKIIMIALPYRASLEDLPDAYYDLMVAIEKIKEEKKSPE